MKRIHNIFKESNGLITDNRKVTPNCFFVCINGENFNANKYALQVLEEGAKFVVVDDEKYYDPTSDKMILVDNSITFLQELALFHRNQFDIPVIGITGSNGKTTTKEILNAVLSKKYKTLATEGNLNNHLGVPFTLLKLDETHEMAIIEMGANKPGDIAELCDIACPTHGIISNIGKAHLEGFKSIDGVTETKRALYQFLEKNDGHIIVNGDDELLLSIAPEEIIIATYGINNQTINGELKELTPLVNFSWSKEDYHSPIIESKLVGKYNFYNFLAAVCFGNIFEVENELINKAIEEYTPTNNRSQVKTTATNTLILDCYNANPSSMLNAVESFNLINTDNSNKIAILGAMKEMGAESVKEHQKLIDTVTEMKIPTILVGTEFPETHNSTILNQYDSITDILAEYDFSKIQNKTVLLKGSRSIELEKLENLL